jgi:hypothetical protein
MAVAATACDGGHGADIRVGGSVLRPSPNVVVQIQPERLAPLSVAGFGCPALPPLTAAFSVVVRAVEVDLRLDSVRLQFIDGSGVGGSPIPFPTPDLVRLFGSTRVVAGTSRSFPFSIRFGCFPLSPTRLAVDLSLLNGQGMPVRSSASAPIQ